MRVIEAARRFVAAKYDHSYHQNAIIRGDWDSGRLIKEEIERIEHLSDEVLDEIE